MEEKKLKEAIKAGRILTGELGPALRLGYWKETLGKAVYYKIPFVVELKVLFLGFSFLSLLVVFFYLFNFYLIPPLNIWVFLVTLVAVLLLSSNLFTHYLPSLYYSWILENVKCPACRGGIKSCLFRFEPRRLPKGWVFEVECKKCNRKFLFTSSTVTSILSPYLILVDEVKKLKYPGALSLP